ncbi:hypothetical protein LOTGIDRAFT_154965 [Lottia gigantea]|uniref:Uncharacterized protein n=1 Tax=Lottia gigantea TaxID=225164 RepID=V4B9D2_LOTGI|nr:hypothetical protein LOTGIDRAFT_154965 [Lottia gigantea]ESO85474.1 hypothetical protein LOTGIDRAFT_154965 [Lottia gigantea]
MGRSKRREKSNKNCILYRAHKPIVDGRTDGQGRRQYDLWKFTTIQKSILTLTEGLINLMNGGNIHIVNYIDLVQYSKLLHETLKTGRETNRLGDVIKATNEDDEYIDDDQEIKELDDISGESSSGEGITFLSDDPEQLTDLI